MHGAKTINFNLKNDDFFFWKKKEFYGEVQSSNPFNNIFYHLDGGAISPWLGLAFQLVHFSKKLYYCCFGWVGGFTLKLFGFLNHPIWGGVGVCYISCSGSTINWNISQFFSQKHWKILSPYYSVENFRKLT